MKRDRAPERSSSSFQLIFCNGNFYVYKCDEVTRIACELLRGLFLARGWDCFQLTYNNNSKWVSGFAMCHVPCVMCKSMLPLLSLICFYFFSVKNKHSCHGHRTFI
jgi:hypothetical protein